MALAWRIHHCTPARIRIANGAQIGPRSFTTLRKIEIALALLLSSPGLAVGATYRELRAAGIKRCESIDAAQYQSGLAFNPDGYRSYYVRSQCYQSVALEFRDERLCSEVKQRRSLLWSSWGYAKANCQKLVREGIGADRKILEARKRGYLRKPVWLRDFRIETNGNGRDFDIVPSFVGPAANAYTLRFDIVLDSQATTQTVLLHRAGYHISGSSNLRIYVRQQDIRQRFPQFALGYPYRVRASLVLAIGFGGESGKWSDEFIENNFSAKERTQTLEKQIKF